MLSYHTCPLATLGGKDTGGMNVYVRDLTTQLGRMGVHVDVYTRSQDEHVPHVIHDLGYGNRVVHVPAGPEVPLPKQKLAKFTSQFVSGIQEFTTKKCLQYDILHSHYWMSAIAARDLSASWGTPVVHMFHTLGIMKDRVSQGDESSSEYRIQGEQDVLKSVDKIVVATPAELAQLQWLYNANVENISIISPGVDVTHFYPISPDEAKEYICMPQDIRMLLYVGRIEPLKGIDTLIQALLIVREKCDLERGNICLAIIGGEPDEDDDAMTAEMTRLQALCSDLGLNEYVKFLGKKSQDSLPYYYSAAEVVVLPSHYESFGMVALEAMACGTPVVASQVGGLAYLIKEGETGFFVPDQEPDALSERLMQLLQDDELRQQMGDQAAEYAQEYRWEIIAERIIEVYQEVISQTSDRK